MRIVGTFQYLDANFLISSVWFQVSGFLLLNCSIGFKIFDFDRFDSVFWICALGFVLSHFWSLASCPSFSWLFSLFGVSRSILCPMVFIVPFSLVEVVVTGNRGAL